MITLNTHKNPRVTIDFMTHFFNIFLLLFTSAYISTRMYANTNCSINITLTLNHCTINKMFVCKKIKL